MPVAPPAANPPAVNLGTKSPILDAAVDAMFVPTEARVLAVTLAGIGFNLRIFLSKTIMAFSILPRFSAIHLISGSVLRAENFLNFKNPSLNFFAVNSLCLSLTNFLVLDTELGTGFRFA